MQVLVFQSRTSAPMHSGEQVHWLLGIWLSGQPQVLLSVNTSGAVQTGEQVPSAFMVGMSAGQTHTLSTATRGALQTTGSGS